MIRKFAESGLSTEFGKLIFLFVLKVTCRIQVKRRENMFDNYLAGFQKILQTIECTDRQGPIDTNAATEMVIRRITRLNEQGKAMFWIGNGGSAAIAVHSTLDYFRTGNLKTQAFYDGPMMTCLANDFGYVTVFQKPLSIYAAPDDVLVAISSSGKSTNILNGVETAREKGCYIITFSGFCADNPLRLMGDLNFYVPINHYGYVELAHSVLCHSFLDLYMAQQNGGI
jgi:D-sedoheptulose 7-phosphate isomerase